MKFIIKLFQLIFEVFQLRKSLLIKFALNTEIITRYPTSMLENILNSLFIHDEHFVGPVERKYFTLIRVSFDLK